MPLHLAYYLQYEMRDPLHSLSTYEEIVAHANLNMMTKLTDRLVATDYSSFRAKERSEAFLKAWLGAKEEILVELKEGIGKLPQSDFD